MNKINVILGDITKLNVDIIVNAANKTLLGGAGVDGAIHYYAGPRLLEECKLLNGCLEGEAKMTNAYNLPCKKIIHTVGPIYSGGNKNEEEILTNCYKNSLALAEKYRLENELESVTIAFPCISTGAFGYPKDKACIIAYDTVKNLNYENINVIFVCYEELDYKLYYNKINGIEKSIFDL